MMLINYTLFLRVEQNFLGIIFLWRKCSQRLIFELSFDKLNRAGPGMGTGPEFWVRAGPGFSFENFRVSGWKSPGQPGAKTGRVKKPRVQIFRARLMIKNYECYSEILLIIELLFSSQNVLCWLFDWTEIFRRKIWDWPSTLIIISRKIWPKQWENGNFWFRVVFIVPPKLWLQPRLAHSFSFSALFSALYENQK